MLTSRQSEVLQFIERHLKRTGLAPTLQEICGELGIASVSTAYKHVSHLERKGYIARQPHTRSGIAVLNSAHRNGAPWVYCDRDHYPVLHQQERERCPACCGRTEDYAKA